MPEDSNNAAIMESVLNSVKQMVGINKDDPSFDIDILIHINAGIYTLYQLGVIPMSYTVQSEDDAYSDFMANAEEGLVNEVKFYLACKTKLGFDTPSSASVIEVLKEQIKEAEWRMMVSKNPDDTFE